MSTTSTLPTLPTTKHRAGTGFGGSASLDALQIRESHARAEQRAVKEKKKQRFIIEGCRNRIEKLKKSAPSQKVVTTICQVLRGYVPSPNGVTHSTYKLIMSSLAICDAIAVHHPKLLGEVDGAEQSLMSVIDKFGQQMQLLDSLSSGCEKATGGDVTSLSRTKKKLEMALTSRSKAVRDACLKASKDHRSSATVRALPLATTEDERALYSRTLRKLCFHAVPSLGHFHGFPSTGCVPTSKQIHTILKEVSTYPTTLPIDYGSSVVLRMEEGQSNKLRAMIIGPEDTPYANGCFFFDILLGDYPQRAPQVQFLTTGGGRYRFNPNLYNCGKVCLSLLGTWQGPGWTSSSTLLQVLVSIQALVFVEHPYFNEPGYEQEQGTSAGDLRSNAYNKNIRKQTMECAILPWLAAASNSGVSVQYPEFRDAIDEHFRLKGDVVMKQLDAWLELDSSLATMHASAKNHKKAIELARPHQAN